jgi:predicted signal transduction protein with EAL and GGDEF domain
VERGSIDALTRAAEIAMCAAKEAGRNRVGWFDPAMARALQARNELEQALRDAIPAGQIIPYFEQQIDLATGQLFGFEVLARWDHPVHGIIPPDRFITIAEQTGMIADLSLAVMRQAFHAARDWDPSLSLSINISPAQLRDAWLPQKIIKLLLETGFPAHRLEIEITEGALFENLPLAQSIVGSLKNQGARLALDDFGTGYSSLEQLRDLPFDAIEFVAYEQLKKAWRQAAGGRGGVHAAGGLRGNVARPVVRRHRHLAAGRRPVAGLHPHPGAEGAAGAL